MAKESISNPIVRKELILWYAERLVRRDCAEYDIPPDFADDFLSRHPSLASTLEDTGIPSIRHELGPFYQRRQKDRTRELYGDSPPPPRQYAAFPDGDIIYHCNDRYIVRHGDAVTEFTTGQHGMGANDHPNEALALCFVKEHTTISVPELISSDWDRVTMQHIESRTLRQAWPLLTPGEHSNILAQLKDYMAQMCNLGGIHIGRLDGQGVIVPSIMTRSGGPFGSLVKFHDWLFKPPMALQSQSIYWHQITTQLGNDCPIVLTHGDIAGRNIIVREGRIVAILDWEFAGWYPEYWDYVSALSGLDGIDWETLGQHLPLLFEKRYDLEYILLRFITSIS